MDKTEKLFVSEASHLLGLCAATVRQFADSGILKSYRVGRYRVFDRAEVESFAKERLAKNQRAAEAR